MLARSKGPSTIGVSISAIIKYCNSCGAAVSFRDMAVVPVLLFAPVTCTHIETDNDYLLPNHHLITVCDHLPISFNAI
jgi:hypothetical protein